ncbi:hypothetical protein D9O36_01100 [Zobellia amurskyensis]|uniref:FAR-17a/AIG1-like protein n=1 Tax=Zobellia amurskyensis TaxID=248905 RepID=A0A7X2ZQB5_9FLAO|nr:hypothetical protein [Zobellia amurskyensis]
MEILGFCIGLFALVAQLALIIQNRQASVIETIIRYFSFFTILTNTLVVLFFAKNIFNRQSSVSFWGSKGAFTAITTFILIVGLVYQFVLRQIWIPDGLQLLVDELLHSVIPLFFFGYWVVYSKQADFDTGSVFKWLIYPIAYIVFVMTRGHFSNFYPYPFLDIKSIGTEQTLINILGLILVFIVLLSTIIFIGKKLKK